MNWSLDSWEARQENVIWLSSIPKQSLAAYARNFAELWDRQEVFGNPVSGMATPSTYPALA